MKSLPVQVTSLPLQCFLYLDIFHAVQKDDISTILTLIKKNNKVVGMLIVDKKIKLLEAEKKCQENERKMKNNKRGTKEVLDYIQKLEETVQQILENIADQKKKLALLEETSKKDNENMNTLCQSRDNLQSELEKLLKERKIVEISYTDNDRYMCPICCEIPVPPKAIYQCPNGHIYCETCKRRPEMTRCPNCRVPIAHLDIRCRYMEETVAQCFQLNGGAI